MTAPATLRLDDVHKRFGRVVALDGVSFAIAAGELVGLVGPNGAGKTTALRILAGYLDADRGRAEVTTAPGRSPIGYLPEHAPVPLDLTVAAFLGFRARLKGVARSDVGAAITRVCGLVELEAVRDRVIGTLSKGFRQRVGLADALIADPPILILDEPTAGMDPMQVRELRRNLATLAAGRAVIVSTHALDDLEALATRVIVLARGRVVADDAPQVLVDRAGTARLEDAVVAAIERGAGAPP